MTQPPKSADEIVDEPFRPSSPQPRAFLILGAMETMTNTNNLLPCPFCGGEPKYEVWSDRNYHKAECVDCAFEFDYCQTYEELEASWNKRVAPAPCLHQIQEPAPVQADARDADGLYYLQDARWSAMVGNCPSFWRLGGGYTTSLDDAERFTLEAAMKQHKCRETDLPWLCSELDTLRRPTIDCQYMPRSWVDQRDAIATQAAQQADET